MAINMLIGYKNHDGSVDSIFARVNGGEDHNKLFYKYYRTPERVRALIENGSNASAIGIYISSEELDKNSKLYNEEVTMLPLHIGQGEEDRMISFSEDMFYEQTNTYKKVDRIYSYESVEKFFLSATSAGFDDNYVYLFNPDSLEWTRGYNGESLRDAIIADFEINSKYEYDSEKEIETAKKKLIDYMNKIDSFIHSRNQQKPTIIDESTNNLAKIDDPRFIQMYNALVSYARTRGIYIKSCTISQVKEQQIASPEKHL